MGISIELWRMSVGSFVMALKCKTRLKTLRLKYVSLTIRILLFFFLLAEGLEANPGPGSCSGDSKGTFSRGRGAEGGPRGVDVLKVVPRGVEVLKMVPRGVEVLKVVSRGVEVLKVVPRGVEVLKVVSRGVEVLKVVSRGVEVPKVATRREAVVAVLVVELVGAEAVGIGILRWTYLQTVE